MQPTISKVSADEVFVRDFSTVFWILRANTIMYLTEKCGKQVGK